MNDIGMVEAIGLGVVQGLTEFLPVSSSGHLVVAQQLLGLTLPAQALAAFDVALHAGTLLAVIIYFWRDLLEMLRGRAWRLMGWLVLGTLPAAAIGIPFKSHIEALFTSVTVVGVAWIFTGIVLWATQYVRPPRFAALGSGRAVGIGIAQAIAMVPGISRSGSTIAAGMFLRLNPSEAARYSFLLAIPAIGGGLLFEMEHLLAMPSTMIPVTIAGIVSSGLVGYVAIRWLLRLVARGQFRWFGVYCLGAGILTLIFS